MNRRKIKDIEGQRRKSMTRDAMYTNVNPRKMNHPHDISFVTRDDAGFSSSVPFTTGCPSPPLGPRNLSFFTSNMLLECIM
jgi:hypothetical protein